MEFLNQCSSLFSLLAVLAAIIVPIVIFKNNANTMKKPRKEEMTKN